MPVLKDNVMAENHESEKKPPLITVGVSAFNRKAYLEESLRSLECQTFRDFEIIVVDDGSTDGTGEMMREKFPGIRYLYQENRGDAAAKNKVAENARGRYLVFNDSDDLFLPDALERLYAPLSDDPFSCSYGQYITINAEGEKMPTRSKMRKFPSGNILPELLTHIIVHSYGTMMPLALFRRIGGYDTSLRCGYDYRLALELAVRANLHAVEDPVFLRRRHGSNLSSVNYEKTGLILKVLTDFAGRHPEIRAACGPVIRKRIAALHGKLAREAEKESLPPEVIRRHLETSLKTAFSLKVFFRYLAFLCG